MASLKSGILAAVCAPFFIAMSIMVIKQVGSHVFPLVIAALGPLLAVPMLLVYHYFRRSSVTFGALLTRYRGPFLQVLLSRIVGQILIVAGFAMTTAVKSILLLRLEPLFVLVWAVAAGRERLEVRKIVLLAALLGGAVLVVAPTSVSAPNLGDACVVASLFFFSYGYAPTETAVKGAGAPSLNVLLCLTMGIVLVPVAMLASGGWRAFLLAPADMTLIASYSLVFFVIASSLYFFAFHTVKPWLVASILSLEVVFGVFLAVVWRHETISSMQFIGCLIVMIMTLAIAQLNKIEPSTTPL